MMKKHPLEINVEKCISCGACLKDCPENNLVMKEKKAAVKSQDCMKCGHCVAVCPRGAVSIGDFEAPIELEGQPRVDGEQLLQALQARRSIRQFTKETIPQKKVNMILEAGRWTPRAKNDSSVSYLVLEKEKDNAEALAVTYFKKLLPLARLIYPWARGKTIDDAFFFKGAPLVIVLLSKDKVSASLAGANMALMGESLGLGILYSGFFTIAANGYSPLRRVLKLKRGEKVVTTLVLGYPQVTYYRTAPKEKALVRKM